jgi:adenylate cyclase
MACEVRFRTGVDSAPDAAPRSVVVEPGTTLLDAVRSAGLPIARACGGGGLCGRCGLEILAGAESLAPERPAEASAKRRNRIDPALRLACRVCVEGPLEVRASYW